MHDPHDKRTFRTWLDVDAQGRVLALHEFEAGTPQPLPNAVDVTHLGPTDWSLIDAPTRAALAAAAGAAATRPERP